MLQINGKTFMNLQEAVQWLLDNNALPFQSSANYVANTEIGLGTIINPSPAKVRIGSLIFFADSKVSTVTGLTENGFIVSDQYNDLVDDVVYVSNVALNASGHLIVTLSNGTNIDAGLIKQVAGFSIDGSQHLIVSYNDGTSTDLGAIFSGNITVSGNLTVTGGISGNAITGDSIIENMSGYSATMLSEAGWTFEKVYIGAVKTGNKITFAGAFYITKDGGGATNPSPLTINFPSAVGDKLFPAQMGLYSFLDVRSIDCIKSQSEVVRENVYLSKNGNTQIQLVFSQVTNLETGVKYYCRYEATFLLSDSL